MLDTRWPDRQGCALVVRGGRQVNISQCPPRIFAKEGKIIRQSEEPFPPRRYTLVTPSWKYLAQQNWRSKRQEKWIRHQLASLTADQRQISGRTQSINKTHKEARKSPRQNSVAGRASCTTEKDASTKGRHWIITISLDYLHCCRTPQLPNCQEKNFFPPGNMNTWGKEDLI